MTLPSQTTVRAGESHGHRWEAAILLAILCLGTWVRFSDLTARELWLDESCTFYYVHHLADWPRDGPDFRLEVSNIPYTALLWVWTRFAGETAWGLRSFSALVGSATILALWLWGRRLGGPAVGLAAVAFAALHPLHIHYSQEARVYALWCLEITLALDALHRAAAGERRRWWFVYGCLALLTTATHYYALFWLPATITAVVAAADRRRFLHQWLACHAAMAVALLPLVLFLVRPLIGRGSQVWLRETWQGYPPVAAIPRSIWALIPSGGYPDYTGFLATAASKAGDVLGAAAEAWSLWAPAVMLVIMLAALALARRSNLQTGGEAPAVHDSATTCHRGFALTGLLVVSTLFVPWIYSLLLSPAYIVGRYDMAAWPPLLLAVAILPKLLAHRLSWSPPGKRALIAAATLLMLTASAVTLFGARSIPPTTEIEERARRLQAAVEPGDLVVSLAMYRWFLAYELDRQAFPGELVSFPPQHDRQVGWENPEEELKRPEQIEAGVETTIGRIQRALDSGHRAFLLVGRVEGPRLAVDRQLFAALFARGYTLESVDDWLGLAEIHHPGRSPLP